MHSFKLYPTRLDSNSAESFFSFAEFKGWTIIFLEEGGGGMKIFQDKQFFFCVVVCANNFFLAASSCKQFFCVLVIIIIIIIIIITFIYPVKIHQVILCSKNTSLNITA